MVVATGVSRRLRTILSFSYYTGILVVIRQPSMIVFSSTTPFAYVFFLFVIGGGSFLPFGVIGATITTLVAAGLFLGADATMYRIQYKFQDFAVASPISAVDYMLGLSLGEVTFVAPSLVVILAMYAYLGLINWSFPLVILVMVFAWVLASALGFFLSTFILQNRSAFTITTLVTTLLTVLPPIYYSITRIPPSLRFLVYFIPTTHLAILIQSMLGLEKFSLSQIELSWAALIAYTMLFLVLATLKARWRQP
jgi:ABC-2 type transport system permease protein